MATGMGKMEQAEGPGSWARHSLESCGEYVLVWVEVDEGNRTFRRGSDVDHLATVFQRVVLCQVEMTTEVQARGNDLECVEKAPLAAMPA